MLINKVNEKYFDYNFRPTLQHPLFVNTFDYPRMNKVITVISQFIVLLLRFTVMRTIFIFSVMSQHEIFLSCWILFYEPIKISELFTYLKLRMWFHVTQSKFFFIFLRWEKVVNKTLLVLLRTKLNPGKLISLS